MKNISALLLLALVTCFLLGCGGNGEKRAKPAIEKDTLAYTYKSIKKRADDCGDKADSNCTIATIKYAHFNTDSALNDTVTSRMLDLFYIDNKKTSSIDEMLSAYFRLYKADVASGNRPGMKYDLDLHATVLRQDSSLTTLEVGGYTYQGGAHGGTFTGYINWNNKAHKKLELSDLLVEGYQLKLSAVAEKIFRKNENLSDTSSLAPNYFFENAKFALNRNFCITPVGLKFLYNEYEIKPYAAGQTELLIPYNKIKSLLKPNTVLAQYVK